MDKEKKTENKDENQEMEVDFNQRFKEGLEIMKPHTQPINDRRLDE